LLDLTWDQTSAILEVPMAWVYLAWPVSGALIAADVLVTWLTGRRLQHEAVDIT
jgi:TRAP-type C4-dicarboxylate transport system permease small subunit